MGLSPEFIDAHITKWEKELAAPFGSFREKWPSRLFHHAPIENALEILRSGELLSRNDAIARMKRDIAGVGVIDSSNRAHKFGRLYFRPRTPTQFHIEGIRRAEECQQYGTQAPILFMFVFEARRVLSIPGVHFADQNMQTGIVERDDEDYFSKIPFAKVFHDSADGSDSVVRRHRCAEVLVPSPMSINGTLQYVLCRSIPEREFLIHELGPASEGWLRRIIVSDDLRVFFKRRTFVETVALAKGGLEVRFNPRDDGAEINVRVRVSQGNAEIITYNGMLRGRPPYPADRWRFTGAEIEDGTYAVEIWLEGEPAYRQLLSFAELPF